VADRPPLSVVVPAYQEAGVIGSTVARLREELPAGTEIVVADDGSADGTAAEACASGADRVLRLPHRGKGAAVRAGMVAAAGSVVAFCDADLAYAPDQVLRLASAVEEGWDVAVGSRRHVDAVALVQARRLREVSGRVFTAVTGAVVGGRYDTQCGIKAFRAEAARQIFARSRLDGFAFDVEVFVLARRLDLTLTEVPVELTNSRRSSVRVLSQALLMLRDLARIRWWQLRGGYGRL
jgi:dolichyl-phosphate beta-glucosyltransferase